MRDILNNNEVTQNGLNLIPLDESLAYLSPLIANAH